MLDTYDKKFLPTITPEQLLALGFAKGWLDNEYRYYKDGMIAEVALPNTTIRLFPAEWWYSGDCTKDTILQDLKSMEQYMTN